MIAFRAIKPGKPFQSSIFREEVTREADAIRRDMLDDFKRTTATWEHKVKFTSKVQSGAAVGGVSVAVSTTDKIYRYVDQGTKRHPIPKKPFPKKGKRLWFQTGYKAKTSPNVILSTPGGPVGPFVPARQVMHPGTAPRNFSKVIKQSYTKEFRRRVQNALDRAARRFNSQ